MVKRIHCYSKQVVLGSALVTAYLSVFGWLFWLAAITSDRTIADLRIDPEFDSMVAIADALSFLAPVALILGFCSLSWRPRIVPWAVILVGTIGTCWLSFGV